MIRYMLALRNNKKTRQNIVCLKIPAFSPDPFGFWTFRRQNQIPTKSFSLPIQAGFEKFDKIISYPGPDHLAAVNTPRVQRHSLVLDTVLQKSNEELHDPAKQNKNIASIRWVAHDAKRPLCPVENRLTSSGSTIALTVTHIGIKSCAHEDECQVPSTCHQVSKNYDEKVRVYRPFMYLPRRQKGNQINPFSI